jgi:hypothetical protein
MDMYDIVRATEARARPRRPGGPYVAGGRRLTEQPTREQQCLGVVAGENHVDAASERPGEDVVCPNPSRRRVRR